MAMTKSCRHPKVLEVALNGQPPSVDFQPLLICCQSAAAMGADHRRLTPNRRRWELVSARFARHRGRRTPARGDMSLSRANASSFCDRDLVYNPLMRQLRD